LAYANNMSLAFLSSPAHYALGVMNTRS